MTKQRRAFNGPAVSQKHRKDVLKVSWWIDHAKPEQRDAFIEAAKRRVIERVQKFRPVYGDAPTEAK